MPILFTDVTIFLSYRSRTDTNTYTDKGSQLVDDLDKINKLKKVYKKNYTLNFISIGRNCFCAISVTRKTTNGLKDPPSHISSKI